MPCCFILDITKATSPTFPGYGTDHRRIETTAQVFYLIVGKLIYDLINLILTLRTLSGGLRLTEQSSIKHDLSHLEY